MRFKFVFLLMFVVGSFVSNATEAQDISTPDNIVIELPTFDENPTTMSEATSTGTTNVSTSNLRGRIGCGVSRVRNVGSTVVGKARGVIGSSRSAVRSGLTRVVSRGRSVSSRSIGVTQTVLSRGRGRVRRVLSRVRGIFRR